MKTGPGSETEGPGRAGQHQEPDQQGSPAGLAHSRRGPGGTRLVAATASGRTEHVEGDCQGLPGKEETERVGGHDRHCDRGQQQHVTGQGGAVAGSAGQACPVQQSQGNDDTEAAREREEQAGQLVQAKGRLAEVKEVPEVNSQRRA